MRRSPLAARIAKLEWKVLGGPGHVCIEAVNDVIVGPDREVIEVIRHPLMSCPGCGRVFDPDPERGS
jgi:hypothetical protein